jgi:hypothetical protein
LIARAAKGSSKNYTLCLRDAITYGFKALRYKKPGIKPGFL